MALLFFFKYKKAPFQFLLPVALSWQRYMKRATAPNIPCDHGDAVPSSGDIRQLIYYHRDMDFLKRNLCAKYF